MQLLIIIASTRPERIGDQVGEWIKDYVTTHSDFTISIADLAEINLPLFDEPHHPMLGNYTKEHTKQWSKIVDHADAFIVVTPEYNYTMPPSLLNALDFLHQEWRYKPAAFVGYGFTGAVRAIQTARPILTNLGIMPIPAMVNLTGVHKPAVTTFTPEEKHEQAAEKMIAELHQWAEALLPLHQK